MTAEERRHSDPHHGLLETIDREHLYASVGEAVDAYRREADRSAGEGQTPPA